MARNTLKSRMSRTSQQNRRHRARTAARHSGRRQIPGLHEHMMMMYPMGMGMQSEEAGESSAQEAAESAAGEE